MARGADTDTNGVHERAEAATRSSPQGASPQGASPQRASPPRAGAQQPVAIVGGGSIGVGWAIVFARAQRQVNLFEPEPRRRQLVPGELQRRLDALAEAKLIGEDVSTVARRILVSDDLAGSLEPSCYVQECAPEDPVVKRSVFETLDRYSPPDAVLASSSSALPVSRIAAGLSGAPRCLVAHPGNPPYLLPVVELVPAPFTSPRVVDQADAFLRSVGMVTVRLGKEVEGFVFNRLQGAVLREAYCLVRDGVARPEDIDSVMREGLGRRWSLLGPFEVAELNTRGGIEAHARLMGPAYERMGAERGQSDPWTPDLVATVSRAVQGRFPRERWEEHVEWRDRALMALEACRRANPVLTRPDPSGPDPSGPDLSGPDLSGPDLSGPVLAEPVLSEPPPPRGSSHD